MAENRAPRLAVLIDADNVPASYADAIFEEIAALGEASVRRIYGDWSAARLGGWARKVAALGLVADQQFSNTKGKNASDIGLVIAAMDFLHSGLFDGFVLVSSDSDFTRLAARVRGLQTLHLCGKPWGDRCGRPRPQPGAQRTGTARA